MKDCDPAKIRNFAVAGHAGTGKTSLCDLLLFKSGQVSRLGRVADKTSVSDFRPDEQERKQSLYVTPLHCRWQDHGFCFLDTPGNPDFAGDTVAALHACDLAIIVIDAATGLSFGASRVWRLARDRQLPRFIFVNGLDRENADFGRVLTALRDTFGRTTCVPFILPDGQEAEFKGVASVLNPAGAPAALAGELETYRSALSDTAAESDEQLMERYLGGEALSEAELAKGLRRAIMAGTLVPVFGGSVAKDLGVTELMNGIAALGPAPLARQQLPLADGTLELKADGPGHGFVFKTILDPFIGQLSLVRVYSGKFLPTGELHNVNRGARERITGLLTLNGKEQSPVAEACPGEFVAFTKLASTHTSETLATVTSAKPFPPIVFPKPSVSMACHAVKQGEEEKIANGLQRLLEEDPTLRTERQSETHELLLSGLGDQHLRIVVQKLKANNKVEVELKIPKVPYRETIRGKGDHRYRHKKQTGGRGQFAEVALRVEPLATMEFEFENAVVGGNIPKNYIPAVEKGVVNSLPRGPLAKCKVINVRAIVYDGKYHDVDSSDMAFQIAARFAFREAMKTASPVILEPVQKVRIVAPDDCMGDITGDLNSRRGRILGMDTEEGMQVTLAEVPLVEMLSYASQLRSLTQGRGSFAMEFLRYDQVPANVSQQIQAQAAGGTHEDEEA